MAIASSTPTARSYRRWPWVLLVLATLPAFWHFAVFPSEIDGEFPRVVRPTFSRRPPPAYRLAEPGDTIDRVGIYVASLAIAVSLLNLLAPGSDRRIKLAALGVSLGAYWLAANPSPTFDGWHGLGWPSLWHRETPIGQRALLAAAALGLVALIVRAVGTRPAAWLARIAEARAHGIAGLLAVACVLSVGRGLDVPGVEPRGYWPRWSLVWCLILYTSALVRVMPRPRLRVSRRLAWAGAAGAVWFGLVSGGIWLTWYHRPLARLREIVPGRIFISAMPTGKGLEIAQARHHFRTIINLFPEDTPLRSPLLPQELAFAQRHQVNYVGSPTLVSESDAFLDRTLALARDPSAWPILVHCHGCMDRTPAWIGIYQYVVEGRPLDAIFQFIEQHRGYRPKASVTLLYNRVLPRLAPERVKTDPLAQLLQRHARGTLDPYYADLQAERNGRRTNPHHAPRVSTSRPINHPGRPSLTPRR